MNISRFISLSFLVLIVFSCSQNDNYTAESDPNNMVDSAENNNLIDHHSYSNTHDVYTKSMHLNLSTDFANHTLSGNVSHYIENLDNVNEIIFDIYDEKILKVTLDDDTNGVDFKIGEFDELLGSPLIVPINTETKKVTIFYHTSPSSLSLQWLSPQQTSGKKHPYLYTQGQAVLTRTWIPCQDTPLRRITYTADIQCPKELMALMSAENPTTKSADGIYSFKMDQPIPTYLIALAVGDLEFSELGPRTGVYTEPSMMKKCVAEFTDVEKMVETAESLYGPYAWGRYDIIVLPPSFPFGGMENPKLTFATPTIIAGDKSLVSLIAHELAHSWSGNLVTNATWNDFWLNEGFTVYIENRIMEQLYGREHSDMLLSIEYQELQHENEDILGGSHPEDTHLKLDLKGRNPDDGMTSIAYVKGALFLKTIEELAGREKFDVFLKSYFETYKFQAVTTEMFLDYLDKNLLEPNKLTFNIDEWVYDKGIPENCVAINSTRFNKVEEVANKVTLVKSMNELGVNKTDWTTQEWMHFIRHLPSEMTIQQMEELDKKYNFSDCGNSEIMYEWFMISIPKGYTKNEKAMERFLVNVGRRKFIAPIYEELAKTEDGKKKANEIYTIARPNYHSVSTGTIDEILFDK